MIRIALLPGDGIGPEIFAGPMALLEQLAATGVVEVTGPWPIGASAYMSCGMGLPAETLTACEQADAILFGAVGDHPGFTGQDYRPEASLIFLREHFDLRISIRHVWRGAHAPLTIVRNLLGGAYGGASQRTESDGRAPASDVVQLTPAQIREVVEIGLGYLSPETPLLLSVDKANLLATSRLWRRVTSRLVEERGIACRHVLVDNFAFELARRPLPDGVVVTEGLFGDILSDLAAGRAGSIALCSSAGVHPGTPMHGRCVGLFEPVHGTAPDLVGQGIANPVGVYLALAALLVWFPETAPLAPLVRQGVAQVLETGPLTADLASAGACAASTPEFAERVNASCMAMIESRTR
jgi:isocitrate/isopropylmalate dehydrogenase